MKLFTRNTAITGNVSRACFRFFTAWADSTCKSLIAENPVCIFAKTRSLESIQVNNLFATLRIQPVPLVVMVDTEPRGEELETSLAKISCQKSLPNIFINGTHVGGLENTLRLYREGKLFDQIKISGAMINKW